MTDDRRYTAESVERDAIAAGLSVTPLKWLAQKQAAALLGQSVRTLQRLREKGQGPDCERRGGTVWYHCAALAAWLGDNDSATDRDKSRQPPGFAPATVETPESAPAAPIAEPECET